MPDPSLMLRAWLLITPLVCGCGTGLASAVERFEAGRLPEAAREFRSLEPRFASWSSADRLEYALYRGLTHLALGDLRQAERWLTWVKRSVDQNPRLLSDRARGELTSAWRSMGHMPGDG